MKHSNQTKIQPSSLTPILEELSSLNDLLDLETEFALPSYEDGSMSPRLILEQLSNRLSALEVCVSALINGETYLSLPVQKDSYVSRVLASLQPPATPESLSTYNSDFTDDMELFADSPTLLEGEGK